MNDYIRQIIDKINDHLLHPEKTMADINIFGFYDSLSKLIEHCCKNQSDTETSLQLAELWWVVDDLYNGIVFRRYIRPDENGCLWEYEVDANNREVLNSKNLGKHELSESDKIILEDIERNEERINNERKELGNAEQFKTYGIRIGEFTKREKYEIHSRLDSFVYQEKWAYERRDICKNITTIYQRFDNLGLPRTAHLKYEDYIQKITNKIQPISQTEKPSSTETSSTLIADGGNKILVPSTLGSLTEKKTEELYKLSLDALHNCTKEEFIHCILHPTLGRLSSKQQGKTFILITALLKARIINNSSRILSALGKDANKYAKHPMGNANNKTGGTENLFAEELKKLLNIDILGN